MIWLYKITFTCVTSSFFLFRYCKAFPPRANMVRTVCLAALALAYVCADSHLSDTHYEEEAIYTWNVIEYEWPNASVRQQAISDGSYEPENSAINGIKVYKGKVYVTTPRLKTGVPSTLNVVIENQNPDVTSVEHVLRPFPSWEMQKLGDCRALQLVQSMEIDINTGYMWIVDTGELFLSPLSGTITLIYM